MHARRCHYSIMGAISTRTRQRNNCCRLARGSLSHLSPPPIGVHLLRRSTGHPVSTSSTRQVHPRARVLRYEIGARLYHWGNTLLLLGLTLSGIALFAPGSLGPGSWLLLHEILAALFVLGLALHIVVAPRRGDGRSMWFDARDLRDLRLIAANFLGRTREYPAFGKYDPWQKIYHACLTLLAAELIVSGAYLFISAEAWGTFSHPWMRLMRLTHDLGALLFHCHPRRTRVLRPSSRELAASCGDGDGTSSGIEFQPV